MDISEISTLPTGWAAIGAAVLVLAIVCAAATFRKWRRQDEGERKRRENYNSYIATLHAWQDAIEQGDAAEASQIAIELDEMRKKGWNIAPALVLCAGVLACSLSASCTSPPAPAPETVLLSDHVRIVKPGDTVPDLPQGESFWWIATPKGMLHLLPSDAPVNRIRETPK